MKPTTMISYLFFLVSIITINLALVASQVFDVTGEPVRNGGAYRIGPVLWAHGGGIKVAETINNVKICPPYVVQDPFEINLGDPFRFTHLVKPTYLLQSFPLSIEWVFPTDASCNLPTGWQIGDAEAKPHSNLITTGGSSYSFRVVGYPKPLSPVIPSYMLQYCQSVDDGNTACFNVGLYAANGVRYLAASNDTTPFEFVFAKATTSVLSNPAM